MQMCEVVCCRLVRASIVTFTDQQQQQRSALADLPYRLASLSTARSLSTSAMNVPSSAGPLQDFEWSPTRRRVAGPTAVPTNSAASARNYLVAASSSSLTPPSSSSSLPSSTTPAAEWWRADSDGSCGVSVASATGPPPPLVESRQTPPPAPLRAASAASSSALWYPLVAREPQQRTPPAASQRAASQHASHCSPSLLDNSFLLSPPSAWPSIVDALETPERQRCQHLASTDNSHTHDSGFFDSSTDCAVSRRLSRVRARARSIERTVLHTPSILRCDALPNVWRRAPLNSTASPARCLSSTPSSTRAPTASATARRHRLAARIDEQWTAIAAVTAAVATGTTGALVAFASSPTSLLQRPALRVREIRPERQRVRGRERRLAQRAIAAVAAVAASPFAPFRRARAFVRRRVATRHRWRRRRRRRRARASRAKRCASARASSKATPRVDARRLARCASASSSSSLAGAPIVRVSRWPINSMIAFLLLDCLIGCCVNTFWCEQLCFAHCLVPTSESAFDQLQFASHRLCISTVCYEF